MKTYRVDTISHYVAPDSPYWARVNVTKITMMPTPLGLQPTDYIRQSWQNRPYGLTPSLDVQSVHDGKIWAVRTSWKGSETKPDNEGSSSSTDNDYFPDALAVALPVRNNPVMATMGSENAPIHILRWQINQEGVKSKLATGIGTSRPGPDLQCGAQVLMEGLNRNLVITRAMDSADSDVAPLMAGLKTGVGFVLWQGANQERAGTKAFSIDWTSLDIEA